jgi:hypothetical protein
MTAQDSQRVAKRPPGPKPDSRPQVTFRVEQPVYDALVALQPLTANSPDESARLFLHLLVSDPAGAARRLEALLGPRVESDPTAAPSTVYRLDASRPRA